MAIPLDDYTPHGYLDNPYHTRNLNPSGVIRSAPGIGFAWHYPALPRGYGYREIYNASLNLALTVDGKTYSQHSDFKGLYADIHTKNVFRYRWSVDELEVTATFWRVGENALACRVCLTSAAPQAVRITAFTRYTRHLGAAGVWGESGLVGLPCGEHIVVQGFEDGEAFALGAGLAPVARGAAHELTDAFLKTPAMGHPVVVTGRKGESVTLYGAVAYDLRPDPERSAQLDIVLARDIRRDLATKMHDKAMSARSTALSAARREDEAFWASAPTLCGDWPDHWRRGFVTDLETLRMMIKPPIGIYHHPWDAMQVHAPRVVLAEAAIDALLLGYADLDTAKTLLLGTFLDAPAPNVPCSREDGSYNMVGANGSECGTAPEWGYPTVVIAFLYDMEPDPAWLAAIYPGVKTFLEWWLKHRSDDAGYLVYDNSWESGQDLSGRFGPQKEGGGSTIRMVRPVDLQAAMASACRTMHRFAAILDRHDEQKLWSERAIEFHENMEGLWQDGAYRDFDARVGWSDVWDVMQLAPVALGLAAPERVDALRPKIRALADEPYLWPMFVWTAVDAALYAGESSIAADVATATLDRAYRYWDSRDYDEEGRLPGVACEYWGLDGRCGAEGYGWGAFGVHLVIRALIGFKPEGVGFSLTPNLPEHLLQSGARYGIGDLRMGAARLRLDYLVTGEGDGIEVTVTSTEPLSEDGGETGKLLRMNTANRTLHRFRFADAVEHARVL